MKTAAVTAVTLILVLSQAVVQAEQQIPAAEQLKIEELLGAVEKLKDAQFIRNGKSYGAASTAKFLRGKWKAQESEVRSAEDFIEKVGSFSSTTGRPYAIRFAGGQETPSAQFFRSSLAAQAVKR